LGFEPSGSGVNLVSVLQFQIIFNPISAAELASRRRLFDAKDEMAVMKMFQ